ncbi:MAG: hypothetical protein AAF357_03145 [Verrucomicrobiota bacterium]
MKGIITPILALAALLPAMGHSQDEIRMDYFGDAYQLVYFGVLEGLFRDGVTTEEVDLILTESKTGTYDHFIYACPICMATIHALEFYRERPRFFGLKDFAPPAKFRTFGPGLSDEVRAQLGSDDVKTRLRVIHELAGGWVSRRLTSLNLTEVERENMEAEMEAGRERGMSMLRSYRAEGEERLKAYAPAYADLKECAICNAALRMEFKTE